eukprot:5632325-Prymnesium_polylepis.1
MVPPAGRPNWSVPATALGRWARVRGCAGQARPGAGATLASLLIFHTNLSEVDVGYLCGEACLERSVATAKVVPPTGPPPQTQPSGNAKPRAPCKDKSADCGTWAAK